MKASSALRRYDRWPDCSSALNSSLRKNMRESCWVTVLRPTGWRRVGRQVRDDGADHADGIDAGVAVEAPVLDRQHRLLHARRNTRERNAPPLLARCR